MWLGNVVGIDASLTATGISLVRVLGTHHEIGNDAADCYTLVSRTTPHTCTQRCEDVQRDCRPVAVMLRRHAQILRDIIRVLDVHKPAVVAIESPILTRRLAGGAQVDRIGLYWRIIGQCSQRGIHVVTIAPQQLKKAVTGSGASTVTKQAVADAVDRIWEATPPKTADASRVRTYDESDAAALATIAAVKVAHRQLPIRVTEDMLNVIAGLNWPQHIPSRPARDTPMEGHHQ